MKKAKKVVCKSMHGPSYAPGSTILVYKKGGEITDRKVVCGSCGETINNPTVSTQTINYYGFFESPWKWFTHEIKSLDPKFPDEMQIKTLDIL